MLPVAVRAHVPVTPSALLKTRDLSFSTSSSLQTIIPILALLLLAASCTLLDLRRRTRAQSADSTEYLILESEISIEIGDEGFDIEYEDADGQGRISYETILKSATPHQWTFDIEHLPTLHVERQPGNILERRGRKTLKLRASGAGDADMALLDVKQGRLTLSPFSSRREGVRVVGEFPPPRRRTPRGGMGERDVLVGAATAPYHLEHIWRPLDTAELREDTS
ncbi:hypothetical protein BDY17DRAFT_344043 [Neohortaea acidophila]|uniref:Uncharacterized protein n=1 Tax=Neohortaea acidophila TaxID=245834 RepID=A0A6A6PZG8_9PEZI|nr:uncharacterized protein BDY17DRAFT_344043 [Neohortaea acidophila]KAF2485144.1 hypothetical protein BDY17DRAFT_344043 [Neohortaea acidophila]